MSSSVKNTGAGTFDEGLAPVCGSYAGRVRELLEKGWGRIGPGLAKGWDGYAEIWANGERLESGRMKRAFR